MSINETFDVLSTSLKGISSEEVVRRLEEYGLNKLEEKKKRTFLMMFLDQFKDFMIIVLIAAAVISGIIGEASDTIAIIVIITLNAVIGFVQEYRAEKAMAALKKMAAPSANVVRNGVHAKVPSSQLVPGDIVSLEAGSVVPADIRLVEVVQLKVEEAALTGESVPIEKHEKPLHDELLSIGDRINMAYKGTLVSYGRGVGVAVETGMATELGRIAVMLQEEEEVKTPLQKRLASFGQKLAIVILAICVIVFCFGILRGEPPLLMLLTAISLAVAAIPEALPAVITISLALGANKLVKQNALIRKLPAVETLGSVTYICSDKTGTLTMNRMSVEEIYVERHKLTSKDLEQGRFKDLLLALALSNDARMDSSSCVIGDPTEVALYNIAKEYGFDKATLEKQYPRKAEIPFDADRKCMTTIHQCPNGKFISLTKGAIDVLIERADGVQTIEGLSPIDPITIHRVNESMAADGLRVLGISMRKWDSMPVDVSSESVETSLTVLGLIGMMDPPREEAKRAVSICKRAGIIPVMITGDHPITAKAVATRLGIIEDDSRVIMTGRELEEFSLEEFEDRVEHVRVYARVAPEQKLKIVKALQDKGQFVAMTGDGVNDAPALKRADIGLAMGITGTDVSKEASHMILLDDNFATIVKAIKEGRRIFDNIRKFIKYTMTSNSGEIWTIFLAPFFGLPIPLLPIHILWINLVTDGLPGLALAPEPAERGVMQRPPRDPKESIFAHGLAAHMIWVGLLMGFVSIFTEACYWGRDNHHWQTMVFTVLCLSQMGHALAIRSEYDSLFTMGLFSNKYLLGAVILTLALQMMTIYVPFLNPIFKTAPLTLNELMITLVLSSIVFLAVEVEKSVKRRQLKGNASW
jgi:Ca2+-transporting ATPase